ncbi:MAG: TauD/TfdA family dioxygenase [Candidatus Gracilibacteria bacterium]|jgi:L-asparagine oxygenase
MFHLRQVILTSSQRTILSDLLESFSSEDVYAQSYSISGYLHQRTDFFRLAPPFLKDIFLSYLDAGSFADALVIKNCPLDLDLPSTPLDESPSFFKSTFLSEHLLLMASTLLGTPFAIDAENAGFLIHNIYPVKKLSQNQSSKSSGVMLTLHTELSCMTDPPDFLVLLGLRTADYKVNTPILKLDELLDFLTESEIALLYEPLFITEIDESLRKDLNSTVFTEPFRILSLVDGIRVWRYDVEYTRGITPESQAVVQKIVAVHGPLFHNVVIDPGDLLVINNTRVAHGREPFEAKYDGSDRWLQRVNIHLSDTQKTFYKV